MAVGRIGGRALTALTVTVGANNQQGLDTTTPAGKALFQMCGVFADSAERGIMQSYSAEVGA